MTTADTSKEVWKERGKKDGKLREKKRKGRELESRELRRGRREKVEQRRR